MDKKLKEMLDLSKLNKATEIEKRFEEISRLLFQEYRIKKGEVLYDFLQIEFYYYTKGHEDVITYPRTTDAGKWFFHSSGVDLTFLSECKNPDFLKSEEVNDNYFGGILIQAIRKKDEKGVVSDIIGPQKTTWELFDCFDAFEMKREEFPLIVSKTKEEKELERRKRKITFNKNDEKEILKAKQRFDKGYPKFLDFLEADYQFIFKNKND
ncbi:hypothetical protein LJC57_00145 [Parabacteroides sp. OttesenSCG-928-G07]|nr:hypothetical protein [Parabacteroides sp. OttesenSCG-928-G07]